MATALAAAGIALVQPDPWVTGPRMLLSLSALAGGILSTLLWVVVLRRRIAEKTEILRAVLESTEDGILAMNSEGRVDSYNHKFLEMWGFPEALRHSTSDDTLCRAFAGRLRDAGAFAAEIRRLRRDPEIQTGGALECSDGRVFEWRSAPRRVNGRCVGRVWGFRDVTGRKKAEQRVRSLSAAAEQSPVSIVITDLKGDIEYVNPKFTEVAGYTFEEALGRNSRILKSGETSEEEYRKLWETIMSGAVWRGTFHNRKKSGELYWEAATVCAIRDAQGAPTHCVAVKEDITRQRAAEQADAELAAIVKATDVAIIRKDAAGRVLTWNSGAERMYGYAAPEMLGRTVSVLLPEDRVRELEDIETSLERGSDVSHFETVRITKNGERIDVMLTASPIRDGAGHVIGSAHIAWNTTARKRLERQLAQAQKLESIGQLAAGIAHEINTPIQYIGDNAKFLNDAFQDLFRVIGRQDGVDGGAAADDVDVDYLRQEVPVAITQLEEGVAHVARIVRAMKEFSHPGQVGKSSVDINRALDSTIVVSRNEWKYVAELKSDFDPALPPVPCVAGEMNQVFLNLIVNAAHAIADVVRDTGRKGEIAVSTRRNGDWAEIRVKDTGAGIPEAIRPRVFDPFFTTKEVGKGTGQGLAIAHAVVVRKHQGVIDFESSVGVGTTFLIRLPLESSTQGAP